MRAVTTDCFLTAFLKPRPKTIAVARQHLTKSFRFGGDKGIVVGFSNP